MIVKATNHISSKIFAIAAAALLYGCQSASDPAADEADRQAAEAKLQQMLAEKEAKARDEESRRQIAEERAAAEQAAREAEANKPRYAPQRLSRAARPRTWAAVTIPDLNVKAVFNSSWNDGRLNYRVALLGQKQAIDVFLGRYEQMQINFQDPSGTNIAQFPVERSEFQWAPANFNQGIPTVQATGAVECELPIYEEAIQWNLTWN